MEYPSPNLHPYDDSALGPETFPDLILPPEAGFSETLIDGPKACRMRGLTPNRKAVMLARSFKIMIFLATALSVGNCASTAMRAYTSEQSTGQQSTFNISKESR